jgi:hypothetical protein
MSILSKIKDSISSASQRALGIDGIRFNLQVALERLDRIYQVEGRLAQLEAVSASLDARTAATNDQIQNLKTFLTWYSNRVEPWFWTGNFSQNDPEKELAGLLFNFLPGRSLVDVGAKDHHFAEAATAVGYEVFRVNPPNTIAALSASKTPPATVDFLKVARESFDLDIVKALDGIKPAVVQTEFIGKDLKPIPDAEQHTAGLATTDIMLEMRDREYYWNVVIFRTEAEGFIRMATNLASVPSQAWGSLLFFHDHQLFLKAFYWCKTTLPRFRAAPLAR